MKFLKNSHKKENTDENSKAQLFGHTLESEHKIEEPD